MSKGDALAEQGIRPYGWIQWKGTEVCMDIHCTCGALLHADEDFFYRFQCGECGQFYEVGMIVKMYPVEGHPNPGYGVPILYDGGSAGREEIATA